MARERCDHIWKIFASFDKFLINCANRLGVYLVIGKILNLSFKIFLPLDKFLFCKRVKYWTNNIAIWSHFKRVTFVFSKSSMGRLNVRQNVYLQGWLGWWEWYRKREKVVWIIPDKILRREWVKALLSVKTHLNKDT